jgi:hypothetical protein
MRPETGPDGESYLTSFHKENQLIDVTEDKVPKIMGCPVIQTKNEVSFMYVCL